MIRRLVIKDFRLFKDININMGKFITVISGRNATGKSTLLGMLGNSCELKKKDGVPILQNQFRTEFSEVFKGSPSFDPKGAKRFRVEFCNHDDFGITTDFRDFRIAWQQNGTRFRIIPSKNDGVISTEAKKEWPILYLGLSRLFPIGESKSEGIQSKQLKLCDEDKAWFVASYKRILSIDEQLEDISHISIGETDRKRGVGVSTPSYDYLANSAGQDNIGQILCSLLSFRNLKANMGDSYSGGMLLIDEIDATLHPAAQNRLIEIVISQCRELQLQVVCTTHSTSFLQTITRKIVHNSSDDVNNNIELVYLTNANGEMKLLRNPEYATIENELLVLSNVQNNTRIKVYTEDEETRWFLRNLAESYLPRLNVLPIEIGCLELLKLRKADPEYFSRTLIILDGDVSEEDIVNHATMPNLPAENIIRLPGHKRPEQVFYEYILGLEPDHPFLINGMALGFTLTYFRENGPQSYNGREREKYKRWFSDHVQLFDSYGLFDYWKADNQQLVDEFLQYFKSAFDRVAEKLFIPKLAG